MKKTNLITLAVIALAISTAAAKTGPGRLIHILVFKNVAKPAQMVMLGMKTTRMEPKGFINPAVNINADPSSDYLNINASSHDDMMCRIYDANDNEIAQSEIVGGQAKISTDELPAGTYIARTSLKSGGIVNVQQIQLMR